MIYFETFSVPTADTLFLLILSILTLESAHSIRFLYQHFLSGITEKSLNVFYYACSYAKVDYSRFMNTTARIALKLIPDSLQTQPVFLCVDDTMVSKFGTKFENVSKLFDHAAHNGSNYLNGHCFVSVMLCVPVWNGDKVPYLSVPLGYRMWQKKKSKLELATSMIRQVMPEFYSKVRSSATGKSLPMCHCHRKRAWYKATVFQYHFPGRSENLLCMAAKSTIEPDRK